jgi:putative aminopeptidase FrvX
MPKISGTLTFAWVVQSQYGARGLERLAAQIIPDRVFVFGRGTAMTRTPRAWEKVEIETVSVAALFAETPVEMVAAADIATLAERLAKEAGLPAGRGRDVGFKGGTGSGSGTALAPFAILRDLIETEGVSGHEEHVREAVLRRIRTVPWAKPQVDDKGNITVSFGAGGKELVFVAHMDEVGFEIASIAGDGTATVRARGGMYLSLYEARPVFVRTPNGVVNAVLCPRRGYETAKTAQPEAEDLVVYFGTGTAAETRALGVVDGQPLTIRKVFAPLAGTRASGRSMDDRAGSTALLLALQQIDVKRVRNRVTFAWAVEEETGLTGASFLASRMKPDYAFAVDTFVSTDAPLDVQHLAHATLGAGAVLRGMDSRTVVPSATIDRIVQIAAGAAIPLQIGVTQGGTDASAFSAGGAVDVGLSWPGRYSHSPVEVIDRRDLEALATLIAELARGF